MTRHEFMRAVELPLDMVDGEPQFCIHVEKITSIADPLGINGETLIGLDRLTKRKVPKQEDEILLPVNEDECPFCRMVRENGAMGAISPDNPAPFGPLVHKVPAVSTPKHNPEDVDIQSLFVLYDEAFRIAENAQREHGKRLDGVSYGMNCGKYILCGATQRHLHSQLTGLTASSFNLGDRLGELCRYWEQRYGRSYLKDYLHALRQNLPLDNNGFPMSNASVEQAHSSLLLEENDDAVLFVPIAQRFKNELQIMLKHPHVGNILETTQTMRRSIAALESLAVSFFIMDGYNAHNSILIATRFSAENDYDQRLVICTFPRKSIIAFSELIGRNVIDETPWSCAGRFRKFRISP